MKNIQKFLEKTARNKETKTKKINYQQKEMGEIDIIYNKIEPENIIFKNPYSNKFPKVKIMHKDSTGRERDLILAPENAYLFTYGIQESYNYLTMCLCFNMRTKEGEITFCKNINTIYEECLKYLFENKRELDLGPISKKEDIQLKYPLYPIQNNQNKGFKLFVKLMTNNNQEIQTNFFHEPEDPEEENNPRKMNDEEIKKMNVDNSNQDIYNIYPAVQIESIFIGPNKILTIQCKLVEACIRIKPKRSMSMTPSLKISYKKEENSTKTNPNGNHNLDSDLESLTKKAEKHFQKKY